MTRRLQASCKPLNLLTFLAAGDGMMDDSEDANPEVQRAVEQLIELERQYYFEKRNVKTERQRKVRELVERHASATDGD